MNVKSTFLNRIMSEEMYVEKPKDFEDPKFPHHVYRLKNTLYDLNNVVELGMRGLVLNP